jgi:hypothetical protein
MFFVRRRGGSRDMRRVFEERTHGNLFCFLRGVAERSAEPGAQDVTTGFPMLVIGMPAGAACAVARASSERREAAAAKRMKPVFS